MRTLLLLALHAALLAGTLAEEVAEVASLRFEPVDAKRERTVPVKIYLPAVEGPRPVAIFSHGLGGSRENSPYLGEHWARAGYVAVFVQHHGSDESVWREAGPGERAAALRGAMSLQAALARYLDIPFVLDRLEEWQAAAGHPLKGRLDLGKIGLCGHSFGAVTTQALMGQRFPAGRDFHDPRLKAFFLMSPSASRGLPSAQAYGQVEGPVLCMTGTEDGSPLQPELTPESRLEVYASLPAGDKYQLVLDGAGHFAFSDVGLYDEQRLRHHHPAIQTISTRFWDAYLKGDEAAKTWLQSESPRSDAKLAEKDRWEWK
jgi:predicted dienelactone hydrolase